VVGRELLVHVFEGVIGDAQSGHHLLASSLAFALLLSLMQDDSAAQRGCEKNGSG
jgi:hypothetical protein